MATVSDDWLRDCFQRHQGVTVVRREIQGEPEFVAKRQRILDEI